MKRRRQLQWRRKAAAPVRPFMAWAAEQRRQYRASAEQHVEKKLGIVLPEFVDKYMGQITDGMLRRWYDKEKAKRGWGAE